MIRKYLRLAIILIVGAIILGGCAAPTPQMVPQTVVVPQTVTVPQTVVVPQTQVVTAVPPAATAAPTAAPNQAARQLTVLVGAGQDTEQVMRFFPQNLKVRAGDTVTWKINGDEIHTVSFIGDGAFDKTPKEWLTQDSGDLPGKMIPGFAVLQPNAKSPADMMFDPLVFFATRQQGAPVEHYSGTGFISSGVMGKTTPPFLPPDTPANDKFSVTFDKPGTYNFVCLVHLGTMRGTVTVVAANATDVPAQADIDAQAQKEIGPMIGLVKAAEGEAQAPQIEPGLNGTSIVHVRAGNADFISGDITAQALAFFPSVTRIKAGDTVVWTSTYVHTITFNPDPRVPDFAVLKPQPNGPPMLLLGPQVFVPARPAATYDPTKFYNSAEIGLFGANGLSWSLTFDKPGTYQYYCRLHVQLGMQGTIVVQPK
jgi:plastocyanin